jgi:hypothetical protein
LPRLGADKSDEEWPADASELSESELTDKEPNSESPTLAELMERDESLVLSASLFAEEPEESPLS